MSIFDQASPDDGFVRQLPPPSSIRRPMVASAMRLDLHGKSTRREIDRGTSRDRQRAAWEYYDLIGEVKFAFNLLASIMSRVRIYPAIIVDPDAPPVEAKQWLEDLEDQEHSDSATRLVELMQEVLTQLDHDYIAGGISEMLRTMNLNFNIPGEFFFVRPKPGRWVVASIDEIIANQGQGYQLKLGQNAIPMTIDKDSYVARVWRAHPRWTRDADSSMLGVLEQCEKLTMLDREIRATARTRMHAGLVYLSDGVKMTGTEDDDDEPLEVTLTKSLSASIVDEASINTVVPLFLRGPEALAEGLKHIDLARTYDPELAATADRALERLLSGIDVPKDLVTGLANVKYANAVVIDDGLYRAHIEPGALLAVDALTDVILRPILRRAGISDDMIKRAVFWYDPSAVVTRPDRSTAANEGWDRMILSDEAWRSARGFSDTDAPDEDEMVRRLAFNTTQMSPEEGLAIIKHYAPVTFDEIEKEGQQTAAVPDTVQNLLDGGRPGGVNPTAPRQPPVPPGVRQQIERTATAPKNGNGSTNGAKPEPAVRPGGQLPPTRAN